MKKPWLLCLVPALLLSCKVFAQAPAKIPPQTLKYYEETGQPDSKLVTNDDNFSDYDKGYQVFNGIVAALTTIKNPEVTAFLNDYKDSNKDESRAVILIKHRYTAKTVGGVTLPTLVNDKLISIILHNENKNHSLYLLNITKILVIFITSDEDHSLDNVKIQIAKQDGRLKTSAKDLYSLASSVLSTKAILPGAAIKCNFKFVELTADEVKPPCTITAESFCPAC